MKEIFIVKYGITILVSDEDHGYVLGLNLRLAGSKNYVKCNNKENDKVLHVLIAKRMGLNISKTIDHKNRNIYDCRRENLRVATTAQQAYNTDINKNNTSGFKGVSRYKKKWIARMYINGKKIYLGYYSTPEEAHEAYKAASLKYHGEFSSEIDHD